MKSEGEEPEGHLQCLGVREPPCLPLSPLTCSFIYVCAFTPRKTSAVLALGQAVGKGLESFWAGSRPRALGHYPLAAYLPDIKLSKPVFTFT